VVGAGHSAAATRLALADLDAEVTWAIRSGSPAGSYGGGQADALPARDAIGTRLREAVEDGRIRLVTGFYTDAVTPLPDGGVELVSRDPAGAHQRIESELVVNATGFRPDHTIAAELRPSTRFSIPPGRSPR
jgi:hypothetical protein